MGGHELQSFINNYLVSGIVFLPLVGLLLIIFMGKTQVTAIRVVALITMLADFLLSLVLFFDFSSTNPNMQYLFRVDWIPPNISYQVGVDGISLLLVMLTTLLGPVVILSSWSQIKARVKEYHIFMLMLQTGMLGAFVSLDLFLFYIFWEVMLIPMYFLIGVWGGKRRVYAAIKFFLFTMFGSVLMLLCILYLGLSSGTFDLLEILHIMGETPLRQDLQILMFAGFALAFAIKVPMFPFHTWLPDAHVEAPTAGSVILAGVLLKMGTYGFIRFAMPLFPEGVVYFTPLISVLAVVGIIYGALVAMVQDDVKKLVAYSSVSHLGFVMLGLFSLTNPGVKGALIQMVNHGLSTGALFLIVGIIYERRHTRLISDFGGLSKSMPIYAIFFMIVTLSSVGLPGLNGFVGEFYILIGTFLSDNEYSRYYAVLAASGVILAAVYMLWMFQRVMFGPLTKEENKVLPDLNAREILYLSILLVFIVWIGIYPKYFMDKTEVSVNHFIEQVQSGKFPSIDQAVSPESEAPAESARSVGH